MFNNLNPSIPAVNLAKFPHQSSNSTKPNKMSENEIPFKVGLFVWFCFCVLISMWMFTKFMKGKQQVFSNLHVVEDSLAKMQEQLEMSLRKKSMGCLETLDDFKENDEVSFQLYQTPRSMSCVSNILINNLLQCCNPGVA